MQNDKDSTLTAGQYTAARYKRAAELQATGLSWGVAFGTAISKPASPGFGRRSGETIFTR